MKALPIALLFSCTALAAAQNADAHFDSATKVFRLDAANVTYAFGVNSRGDLQQIYWGGRIAASDPIPAPKPKIEWASFDSTYTNTPQEYAGWGSGIFTEPALKITFADGNRDLVLHYASESQTGTGFDV